MTAPRCPFHVRQGFVGTNGEFEIKDVCGLKSANGGECKYASPKDPAAGFKCCANFATHMGRNEKQVLFPKNDIEFLPDLAGFSGFSEMEIM